MIPRTSLLALASAALLAALPLQAQQPTVALVPDTTIAATPDSTTDPYADSVAAADAAAKVAAKAMMVKPIIIQHMRPVDQRGINVFEAPEQEGVPFTGFALSFGAAFTQQFQGLGHSNTADVRMTTPATGAAYDANRLLPIGHGFNNAVANLYVDAQLAKGVRVAMTSYLSARHHNEAWVKDGYVLIDDSPIDFVPLNVLMSFLSVRAGHFEVNYGDEHFRRTDNGNAMYNPFVGNLIMDAFTTEIGGEVYLRPKGRLDGAFAMVGVTGGEIRGQVTAPEKRSPALLSKLGFDRQINPDVRVRLTGSLFSQAKANSQTLFGGDRAGSRYYDVIENSVSTESANAWSGTVRNPFGSKMVATVLNPFIKVKGFEFFGNIEHLKGGDFKEKQDRTWNQLAAEGVYRFAGNHLYVGGRYNTAKGELNLKDPTNVTSKFDVGVTRSQLGAGWFLTPLILTKVEYVTQKYNDFPSFDIRNGGKFNGFMVEGVIAF